MKKLLFILSIFALTTVACNSNHDDSTAGEEMECCKDAAAKGEKCAKCNHDEGMAEGEKKACCADGDSTKCNAENKECCKAAEAEGRTCDKCAKSDEMACCAEAKAKGEDCAKCKH